MIWKGPGLRQANDGSIPAMKDLSIICWFTHIHLSKENKEMCRQGRKDASTEGEERGNCGSEAVTNTGTREGAGTEAFNHHSRH